MRRTSLLLGALALCSAFSAAPATAQGQACLLEDRIGSWTLVDSHTLLVTDRNHRSFTVRLAGPQCANLDMAQMQVVFHTSMHEGCLMEGDRVRYRAPAFGRTSCVVTDVEPTRLRQR